MAEYEANGIKGNFLVYKGKPLVRDNNIICYGDMNDDYVLNLIIISTKKCEIGTGANATQTEIPDRVIVQVVSTDESKPSHERIAKQVEKEGLYNALDIGIIWLDKMNKKQ